MGGSRTGGAEEVKRGVRVGGTGGGGGCSGRRGEGVGDVPKWG